MPTYENFHLWHHVSAQNIFVDHFKFQILALGILNLYTLTQSFA
jgi:hypothetical protein